MGPVLLGRFLGLSVHVHILESVSVFWARGILSQVAGKRSCRRSTTEIFEPFLAEAWENTPSFVALLEPEAQWRLSPHLLK